MAGYWPSSFLPVYGPRRSQGSCIDQSNYNAWKELFRPPFLAPVERIFLIRIEKDFSI